MFGICYICHLFEETCGYRISGFYWFIGIGKHLVMMVEIHFTAVTLFPCGITLGLQLASYVCLVIK